MSALVQATCPGCNRNLNIPSDWLRQSMRCKHCRVLIQANPARLNRTSPANAPPAGNKAMPVAGVAPAATGVTAPTAAFPVAPVAAAVPVAPPYIPLAAPVSADPPYLSLAEPVNGATVAPPPLRYRPRRSPWPGIIVSVVILAVLGGCGYALWPEISALFREKDGKGQQIAANEKKPDADPTKQPDAKKTDDKKADEKKTDEKKGDEKKPVAPPPDDKKTDEKKGDPIRPPVDGKKPDDKKSDPRPVNPPGSVAYPRRALLVSVHNYLYANPTNYGDPAGDRRNFATFMGRLSRPGGFRISPSQVGHLSDAGKEPYPPVKAVIENTIEQYLKESRPQDRVVLLFAGHGVEIDGKGYLVPIEGDIKDAATLIPLDWVYQQLEACKARQKVFVVDVCRFNPARGMERPGGGPMTPKFDLALKNPPKGVQVWTACTENQQSYEFETSDVDNGLFVDALYEVADKGIEGKLQKPEDPIPLEEMVAAVNKNMKAVLDPLKLQQTSRLSGSMPEEGAAYDPKEAMPRQPSVARLDPTKDGRAEERYVRALLKEVNVPPVKKMNAESLLRYESLPGFPAKTLEGYPVDNTPSELRTAVEHSQVLLWALSPNAGPGDLQGRVGELKRKEELVTDLGTLPESFTAPGGNGEARFKQRLEAIGRSLTTALRLLEEELELFADLAEMRDKTSKRWQVHYDFMRARVMTQQAYLFEYSYQLASMRRELPPRDAAVHKGWRLSSVEKPSESTARKLDRDAKKIYEKIVQEHKGTPWEVLARRELMTTVGLDWKPE